MTMPRLQKPKLSLKEAKKRVIASKKSTQADPLPFDVYDQAKKLIQQEKSGYDDSNRSLKSTIKRAYKNYLGVLDEPYDPYTRRRKIATPLTHDIVDSISKPVRVSSSSIKIVPITNESRGKAKLLNMVLPYFFQEMGFDEFLDQFKHRCAWLGTSISVQDWEYEEVDQLKSDDPTTETLLGFADQEETKKKTRVVKRDRPRIRYVNPLDVFLPATALSLSDAVKNASVILRSVQTVDSIQANPAYSNEAKAAIKGKYIDGASTDQDSRSMNQYGLSGYENGVNKSGQGFTYDRVSTPVTAIYERYGKIPKSWITGKEEDALIKVDGIISAAGDGDGESDFRILSVRLSPFGDYGPFEDCRFSVIPQRYFGEGVGERLIPYQVWHNEIVNNRRNNELLVQHRMFIYRKGKVDPSQFFSRPGGGIGVEDMTDVQPLQMPDIAASSFNEDNYIVAAAQRLAGTVLTPLQKSATATEVQNVQAQANLTSNEFVKSLEGYLERLVLNHMIPLLKKFFAGNKTIPITIPKDELTMLDTFNGYAPFESGLLGDERFLIVNDGSIFDGDFAVTVDIEATGMNKSQQVAAITNLIVLGSKIQNTGFNVQAAFKKIAELSGIYDDRLFEAAQPIAPTGATAPPSLMSVAPPPGAPAPGGLQTSPIGLWTHI